MEVILVVSYVLIFHALMKIFEFITENKTPVLKYKNNKLYFSRGFQTVTLDSKTSGVFFEVKRKPQKRIELSYRWTETEGKHKNTIISNVLVIEVNIDEAETINEIYKSWYNKNWPDFERAIKYKDKTKK